MNTLAVTARGLALTSIAVFVAGCSNAGSGLAPTQDSQASTNGTLAKSWMRPDAKNKKLLYISDRNAANVSAYSYPALQLMGQITGFTQPQGLCSASATAQAGNFWVVNTGAANIVEYAHGGTTPIATISDPGQAPRSCSFDSTTGNLAVGNIVAQGGGSGSVNVYANATGSGKNYNVAGMDSVYWIGYDNKGNLFADGTVPPYDEFLLAELPAGGSAFIALNFPTFVAAPGSIMWGGPGKGHLVVCDAQPNTNSSGPRGAPCYRIKVQGNSVKIVSATYLLTTSNTVLLEQSTLTKNAFIAPIADLDEISIYKYPSGGNPKTTIPGPSGGAPWGSALSVQKN